MPLYLPVACGVTNIEQRHIQAELAVSLLLEATVVGTFCIGSSSYENWRSPMQQVELRVDSNDIVIFQPTPASVSFQRYYDGTEIATATVPPSGVVNESHLREQRCEHDCVWILRYRVDTDWVLLRLLEDVRGDATTSGTV